MRHNYLNLILARALSAVLIVAFAVLIVVSAAPNGVALAGENSDVVIGTMEAQINLEAPVVNTAAAKAKSHATIGGITNNNGRLRMGKFSSRLNIQATIVNTSAAYAKARLNVGGYHAD